MTPEDDIQLIPQHRAQDLLGVSAMTLWRWQKNADFPQAIAIQGRKYFRAAEIQTWIDAQGNDTPHEIPDATEGRTKGRAEHVARCEARRGLTATA